MTEPLSTRVAAIAQLMTDHRTPPPRPEDYAHLDPPAAPAAPPPAVEPAQPAAPSSAPGWDSSASDALPDETRAAVVAGVAVERGRSFLELEAAAELQRPADVHLHLTDPARYVDGSGRVDRTAIRTDLDRLTRERPELARYGHGPGQEPARPDERRHAAPGGAVGAGTPPDTLADRVAAARAVMEAR